MTDEKRLTETLVRLDARLSHIEHKMKNVQVTLSFLTEKEDNTAQELQNFKVRMGAIIGCVGVASAGLSWFLSIFGEAL